MEFEAIDLGIKIDMQSEHFKLVVKGEHEIGNQIKPFSFQGCSLCSYGHRIRTKYDPPVTSVRDSFSHPSCLFEEIVCIQVDTVILFFQHVFFE